MTSEYVFKNQKLNEITDYKRLISFIPTSTS